MQITGERKVNLTNRLQLTRLGVQNTGSSETILTFGRSVERELVCVLPGSRTVDLFSPARICSMDEGILKALCVQVDTRSC